MELNASSVMINATAYPGIVWAAIQAFLIRSASHKRIDVACIMGGKWENGIAW